jgi:hypothetical protein
MKVPNADRAVIAREKLRDYLLNPMHRRGGPKARLLISLGYHAEECDQLEQDLRSQHLTNEVTAVSQSEYGVRFEIVATIVTPSGAPYDFRSVWQIDEGSDVPRLITLYPS